MIRRRIINPPMLIPLTQNQWAIVDAVDYDRLVYHKWYAAWSNQTQSFYARTRIGNRIVPMHEVVKQTIQGAPVDHWNGNTLDNRRNNLRTATSRQNAANRKKHKNNTTGFKGVVRDRFRFRVQIGTPRRHLGMFNTPEEAARAYNIAAVDMYGEFARINEGV